VTTSRSLIIALCLAGTLVAAPAPAQDERDLMELIRAQISTNRQALVAENLALTPAESEVFWPLYRRYQADRAELADRRVALLTEFRDSFDQLTDEQARRMLDDYVDYESDTVKLRRRYIRQFRKVLPERTVLRYFQIENKLDTIVNFELSRVVPLAERARVW